MDPVKETFRPISNATSKVLKTRLLQPYEKLYASTIQPAARVAKVEAELASETVTPAVVEAYGAAAPKLQSFLTRQLQPLLRSCLRLAPGYSVQEASYKLATSVVDSAINEAIEAVDREQVASALVDDAVGDAISMATELSPLEA